MNALLRSIDVKRALINVALYLAVVFMYLTGPAAGGALGTAIWIYVWFFPLYFIGYFLLSAARRKGSDK